MLVNTIVKLPYSGKLLREKIFMDRVSVTISWRKLLWNAKPNIGTYGMPKFRGENFRR